MSMKKIKDRLRSGKDAQSGVHYGGQQDQTPDGKEKAPQFADHEIMCIAIVLTTVAIALFLGLTAAIIMKPSKKNDDISVCNTTECQKAAARFKYSIDPNADPCTDFYAFACGKWMEQHEDKLINSSVWSVKDDVFRQVKKDLLEKLQNKKVKYSSQAIENAKTFYEKCVKTSESKDEYVVFQMEEILSKLGGFPLLENLENPNWTMPTSSTPSNDEYDMLFAGSRDQWMKRIGQTMRLYGQEILISLSVEQCGDSYCIHLSRGSFGMDPKLLANEEKRIISAYEKQIVQTREDLVHEDEENSMVVLKEVQRMVQFEIQIAQRADSDILPLTKVTTLAELQADKDAFYKAPLAVLIKEALGPDISMDTKVLVKDVGYFRELWNLMENTGESIINNYLSWRLIQKISPFKNALDCLKIVNNYFNEALIRLWSIKNFTKNADNEVIDLAFQVVRQMQTVIFRQEWMEKEAQNASYHKLRLLNAEVGFPSWIFQDDVLDAYYNMSKLSADVDYLQIIKMCTEKRTERQLRKLNNDSIHTWHFRPLKADYHYDPKKNKLSVSPFLLQLPYFNEGTPISVKYGGLGFIVASEAYGAITGPGFEYDAFGHQREWFPELTRKRYYERASCFEKQYSGVKNPLTDMLLDGNRTVERNIADNAGVNVAHEVFTNTVLKDERLGGLEQYSTEQLFFISFAASHCMVITKEAMKDWIVHNEVSPIPHRINLAIGNHPEFSKAFKCEERTPMNPDKKCEVW